MKRRSFCSSVSPTKYNLSIIIASSVFTFAIALLYILTSIYFDVDTILSRNGLLLIVNATLAAITALGFGYLFAQLTDSMNIISALSNIFGLGSSFLCGIFVPRELLGEEVSIIGKFFPTYWYINVNEALACTPEDANATIATGLTIQLLFIIAIFILGMVANRLKNKK
jgi:ABC-2 type transport system permease protein